MWVSRFSRTSRRAVLLSTTMIFAPSIGWAPQQQPATAMTPSGAAPAVAPGASAAPPPGNAVGEVIVTAQWRSERVRDVPITGVTADAAYPDAVVSNQPWHVASELKNSATPLDTHFGGVSLRAEIRIGDLGTLTSLTGYTRVNSYVLFDADGDYSPKCVAAFVCITPYVVQQGPDDTVQQELTFSSRKFGSVSFIAGLFLYHDWADYGTAVNPALTPSGVLTGQQAPYFTRASVATSAYAGFGEANWDITSTLHLIAGVRYSYEQEIGRGSINGGPNFDIGGKPSWGAWTPRFSLRYDVTDHANVYATFSEGFKSGVLNAIALTQDVAQPETLYS